jgi:ACS family tartrate transporter-like MFS transporter
MENNEAELERVTLRKVTRRLIPFMFMLYIFNILDRVNVSVAALTMKPDLHLSDEAYGFGAGIFFIGYFIFEVPSNVIMERVGARRWIARIMLTWGLVASSMMFMRTAGSFYALRFLLGVAEAGFFPGMMLYLTYWFPNTVRGRSAACFIVAGAIAGIIGGPLGAELLNLNGMAGLKGWQWLFLIEGIPSFLLGFAVLAYMTDKPEQAHWLQPDERDWLTRTLAREQTHRQKYHHMPLLKALRYPRVLHLSALFFLNAMSGAGLGFFGTLILKERTGWSDQQVLWIGAIPSILGAISLLVSAAQSDRLRERRLFVVWGYAIGAVGLVLTAWTRTPFGTLAAYSLIAVATQATNAPFWALTTGFLSGAAAAGGIAFINSVGNSGSFFGSTLMGYLKTHTQGYQVGLMVAAILMALTSLVAYLLPPDPASKNEPEPVMESAPLDPDQKT